jgi:uncharacterized membrane protein
MRSFGLIAALSLLLPACGGGSSAPAVEANQAENGLVASEPVPQEAPAAVNAAAVARPSAGWTFESSGKVATLAFTSASGAAAIRIACPAPGRLLVNVPGFRPVGSEERLSFGSGGEVVALVAGTSGDKARGGVSGTGEVPANLAALIAGPISASYGAQTSGPHPAPPAKLASAFAAACRPVAAAPAPAPTAGACSTQGTERLAVAPLRAVGTEPFWGARIDGRCVTYSHPDDPKGTRIWTRYTAGANGGGTWSGSLGGKPFELIVRPKPGCSDGMSDKTYPLAAALKVKGEKRNGCAAPL